MSKIVIYTDGSALGNPGPGGWGYVFDDGTRAAKGKAHLTTSNRMEFTALIAALKEVPRGSKVEVRTDSRLLINLVEGRWKAKTPEIVELLNTVRALLKAREIELHLTKVVSKREEGNLIADRLAKEGMRAAADELPIETCERCGKPMVPRVGRYGVFLACINAECGNTKPLPEKERARVEKLLGIAKEPKAKAAPKRRRRRS